MRVTITASFFIAVFITSVPVAADTLLVSSVYFDSVQTLKEVITLSSQNDNEGIAKLIEKGHVSSQTVSEMDIVVLISGSTPDSPAEFRFLNGPTTFWTFTKNVTNLSKPIPPPTPEPTPTPTPEPTPTPTPEPTPTPTPEPTPTLTPVPTSTPEPVESPTPASKHRHLQHENHGPFDDDNGQRIWHQVNGKWKWYPANKQHHLPVKKALPPDEAPLVKP
jgi:outer membrane biosynthesis protein TonB